MTSIFEVSDATEWHLFSNCALIVLHQCTFYVEMYYMQRMPLQCSSIGLLKMEIKLWIWPSGRDFIDKSYLLAKTSASWSVIMPSFIVIRFIERKIKPLIFFIWPLCKARTMHTDLLLFSLVDKKLIEVEIKS